MDGKRGRCALCTINKEDIKNMKQIKKLASLLLAAVLAMTLLAGCGGNVGTAITEQSLLKYINKTRANAAMGLSPVKNDPTLARAAAKLLEACAGTQMVEADYGTGYKLTKQQVEDILHQVPGKTNQSVRWDGTPINGSFFVVTPNHSDDSENFYLLRRANKVVDYKDGYTSPFIDFFGYSDIIERRDLKVGIAFREIKGERFAVVVYDVTNPAPPTSPAP